MSYLIGHGIDEPCPVCGLNPLALQVLENVPELAECGRCALTFVIIDEDGKRLDVPRCGLSASFVPIFRTYYEETGHRLGPPPAAIPENRRLDPERVARMRELDDWLRERPHLIAGAAAPASWPYVSITAVVATNKRGELGWSILAPPSGVVSSPIMPVSCEGLPLGTICSLSVPLSIDSPEARGNGRSKVIS